ncbi:MAG: hypothetical protein LBI16_04585 [Burkholderiales bacterium]|nr:hypothetical protein [Burkholderiales bacterium]
MLRQIVVSRQEKNIFLFLLYFLAYSVFFYILYLTRPHEAGSLPVWVPIFHIGMVFSSLVVFLLMLYIAADKDPPAKKSEQKESEEKASSTGFPPSRE